MREELKNFDWHINGLSKSDFDYTIRLIREIIEDRQNQLKLQTENVKGYDIGNILDNSTGIADEALADLGYYNYIDNLNLWNFGLWRLQGIFEGILKQEFFPDKKLNGLKSKLKFIIDLGFKIEKEKYDDILEWGNLRNALSHFPPEEFRPIGLDETDLQEYIDLVSCVIDELNEQKKIKNLT